MAKDFFDKNALENLDTQLDENSSPALVQGDDGDYEEDVTLKSSLFGFSRKAVQDYVYEITENFSRREEELLGAINDLTLRNSSLKTRINELERSEQSSKEELRQAQELLRQKESAIGEASTKLGAQAQNTEALRSRVISLESGISKEKELNGQLSKNLNEAAQYVKNVQSELESRKQQLEELQDELDEAKSTRDSLKSSLEELEARILEK
ncbi:MAG: hypothetical protein Q4B42_03910, partial [Oscillospiraceae bacterium]|nr:hypothetical protein [Oscillospiraceae bacterium]